LFAKNASHKVRTIADFIYLCEEYTLYLTKSSPDTALRDIQYLIDKEILVKEAGGGRSTNYTLLMPEINF
jgi:hypothetical protein